MIEIETCPACGALPCDWVQNPFTDADSELVAARARIDDPERRMMWWPIETAPRSGDVLIFCKETGEMFVAFWGTDPDDGDQQWVFARGAQVSFIVRDPTHWTPLPAPPVTP